MSTTSQQEATVAKSATGREDNAPGDQAPLHAEQPRKLSEAALRALAEAEERRRAAAARDAEHPRPKEIGGRNGPDPVRYGDWEKGGICWDF